MHDITIGCLSLPNGNPAPGPKFEYKLKWLDRLIDHAAQLVNRDSTVVLAGDYDVIPSERDVYKPERWVDDALFRTEVREEFTRLVNLGWTDALRKRYPEETIYTFWDFFRNAYQRNAGLRIDHMLLNPSGVDRMTDAGVYRNVRGWERPSDHAPVGWTCATKERCRVLRARITLLAERFDGLGSNHECARLVNPPRFYLPQPTWGHSFTIYRG